MTVNTQLVFECRTRPLSVGFLPSASLCFWVDVACTFVLKPEGTRSSAGAKAFRDTVLFEGSKDVTGWHAGTQFTWVSLCVSANAIHGREGEKWATIPSSTLVEQKMSHASSQSLLVFLFTSYKSALIHMTIVRLTRSPCVLWSIIRVFLLTRGRIHHGFTCSCCYCEWLIYLSISLSHGALFLISTRSI